MKHLALLTLAIALAACQTVVTLDPPPSADQIAVAADLYGPKPDKSLSIEELTRLADGGNPDAQNDLGAHYGLSDIVKKDLDKSFHYYQLAANQNMPVAQANLGYMYYAGEGVPRDVGAAARWMYKAAIQGHFNAQFALGRMYATGEGVSKNEDTAEKWLLLSAGQGHLDSQIALKYLYEHGAKTNPQQAAVWAKRINFANRYGHIWKITDQKANGDTQKK